MTRLTTTNERSQTRYTANSAALCATLVLPTNVLPCARSGASGKRDSPKINSATKSASRPTIAFVIWRDFASEHRLTTQIERPRSVRSVGDNWDGRDYCLSYTAYHSGALPGDSPPGVTVRVFPSAETVARFRRVTFASLIKETSTVLASTTR